MPSSLWICRMLVVIVINLIERGRIDYLHVRLPDSIPTVADPTRPALYLELNLTPYLTGHIAACEAVLFPA